LHIDPRIISRAPSPDTWSHFTSDEEVSLRVPYDILDQLLYAEENQLPEDIVRQSTKLDMHQIAWTNKHIHSLKNAARGLQGLPPVFM
jgi:NAD+ synthase